LDIEESESAIADPKTRLTFDFSKVKRINLTAVANLTFCLSLQTLLVFEEKIRNLRRMLHSKIKKRIQ
jgi:hypothetical protein